VVTIVGVSTGTVHQTMIRPGVLMREATIVGGHVELYSSRERRPAERIRGALVLISLLLVSLLHTIVV
jgi:hypothetical protein